jgi:hypothetical protein
MAMLKKPFMGKGLNGVLALGIVFSLMGCGTSISGRVVKPDGGQLDSPDVVVYTDPRTESVRVDKEGEFNISKGVVENNEYTLIAEDREGNMGYVRAFKPQKGSNKNIVVRMSRELEGKDAVLEGGPSEGQTTGLGEKILKSSP